MKLSLSFPCHLCVAAFILVGITARADSFTFTANGSNLDASGTITAIADPVLANAFDITAISGTVNGVAITGLLPCPAYDLSNPCASSGNSILFDNLLYPAGLPPSDITVVDFRGVGFALASGLDGIFFAGGTHTYEYLTNAQHDNGEQISFSLTPTPEPSSLILIGTGLLGIGTAVRRRISGQKDHHSVDGRG